jgi:hypothetical protein
MWIANLEDGSSVNGISKTWNDVGKDKRITGVQVLHPQIPAVSFSLTGYDQYYYTKEAVGMMQGSQEATVIAEILGAINHALGVIVEVRMGYTGSIRVKAKPLSRFSYSRDILRAGKSGELEEKGEEKPSESSTATVT